MECCLDFKVRCCVCLEGFLGLEGGAGEIFVLRGGRVIVVVVVC